MASVFKRSRDQRKRRACWYVAYTDHDGKRRTRKGFTDKGLSEQLAAKLENEAMLRKRGLIDPDEEKLLAQKNAPLAPCVLAFENSLGHTTNKYAKLTMTRVRRIIDGCKFKTVADLNPEVIQSFLQSLQTQQDIGHRTYNHYVQAIDCFCNWMVSARRIPANPLVGLDRLNPEVDVRHKRRALLPEEVFSLVQSARDSGTSIQAYSGEQRARVYIVSYMTGLRRNELASLTPASFDLVADPSTLTIEAANSKHRRKDVLPRASAASGLGRNAT